MPGSQLHVHLYRDSFRTPWGFRLQGGKDLNQALTVQRVFSNSPAEGELQRGDEILAIGGEATSNLTHKKAQDAIKNAGGQINLVISRPPPGCVNISPISPPNRPRAPSLQQPPSMPSRSPYGIYQGSNTPAQGFGAGGQKEVMLNRVQSSLDNITLSPRTPDGASHHQRPLFYQAPGQERQFYTPTSLLLEQQKMEEEEQRRKQQQQQQQQPYPLQHPRQPQPPPQQHQYQPPPPQQYHYQEPTPQQQQQYGGPDEVDEGEEPIVPVWERRKQFQEAGPPPQMKPGVRTPKSNPVPKVSRPAPGKTSYSDFGLSYRPQNQPSTASWQPVPAAKPAHAPPPQIVHYSSTPVHQHQPQHHVAPQSPVKAAPPPWQRPHDEEDDTDGTPAWRNTLRSTGVKPWDVDLDYAQQQHMNQEPQRESPQPQGNQHQGQGQGLPGGRDWSQSQVFQFIEQDKRKKPKGKPGPATAPKPHAAVRQYDQQPQHQQQQHHHPQQRQQQHHHQPPPQHHQQQHYHDDIGISDF